MFRQWATRDTKAWRNSQWRHIAALYSQIEGTIHLAGDQKILIEGNSKRIVQGTVKAGVGTICVEGLENEANVMMSGAIVIERGGCVPIELVNLGRKDAYLQAGCKLGTWQARVHSVKAVEEDKGKECDIRSKMVVGELSEEEETVFRALLNEFPDVFSRGEHDVGYCDKIPHRIDLVDQRPVRRPYRRIPINQWDEVNSYLQAHLASGIISKGTSPYSAFLVLVRKKSGALRVCCDFRGLNLKTVRDSFPLPRIDEALESLRGAKLFSSVDLAHGFLQCALKKEDRHKTAFSAGSRGLYEYNRMPMGLVNAPATFARLMQACLGEENIILYLDDILVFADSFAQMITRLRWTFVKLRNYGLKIKPKKCVLFQTSVQFLGHVVSAKGIETDPDKVKAVTDCVKPMSVKEVRSFLGLTGYYRKFVPKYSSIASPLTNLTKDDVVFEWTEECQEAFDNLKVKLTTAPILGYPNYELPFILETDASLKGLGAVLSQKHEGVNYVVAYASRKLSGAEFNDSNYSSMKLELLALKWAVTQAFRQYLAGSECHVYTDNNPIVHFQSSNVAVAEMRWIAQLSDYHLVMHFRSGKLNANADALSRQHTYIPTELRARAVKARIPDIPIESEAINEIEIAALQGEDSELACVAKAISNTLEKEGS